MSNIEHNITKENDNKYNDVAALLRDNDRGVLFIDKMKHTFIIIEDGRGSKALAFVGSSWIDLNHHVTMPARRAPDGDSFTITQTK